VELFGYENEYTFYGKLQKKNIMLIIIFFFSSQMQASWELAGQPTGQDGQKNKPIFELRSRSARPTLCKSKSSAGQNRSSWPALPSI